MANETIAEMLKSISVLYDKQFTKLLLSNTELPSLTSTQMSVLQYMSEHENEVINNRKLEEAFNLSKSTVSGIVQRLQQHGFIDIIAMPNDKRAHQIVFSETFRHEMTTHDVDFQNQLHVMEQRLVRGMTDTEVQQFERLLSQSLANLNANED